MRLYVDQMLGVETARALIAQGFEVKRAEETGQARALDPRDPSSPTPTVILPTIW
jgi:hypothetical protein